MAHIVTCLPSWRSSSSRPQSSLPRCRMCRALHCHRLPSSSAWASWPSFTSCSGVRDMHETTRHTYSLTHSLTHSPPRSSQRLVAAATAARSIRHYHVRSYPCPQSLVTHHTRRQLEILLHFRAVWLHGRLRGVHSLRLYGHATLTCHQRRHIITHAARTKFTNAFNDLPQDVQAILDWVTGISPFIYACASLMFILTSHCSQRR